MNRDFSREDTAAAKNRSILTECPECDAQFADAVEMCYNCGYLVGDLNEKRLPDF